MTFVNIIPDILLEEEGKLQQLHQEHINNPEFQEYLIAVKQLDQQIINNLRHQQWETKGYDLSPEELYIARKQLEEGKHINLENPQEAESFYKLISPLTYYIIIYKLCLIDMGLMKVIGIFISI
ncbi:MULTISPECIES: hypothetical protein [unclassified Candidatus Tisiphia]|uniref:hypothetical protein n=1 Tax=unclassified Candidatus Tisiphia TaxID=2996318 RepID=UPI00312CBF65